MNRQFSRKHTSRRILALALSLLMLLQSVSAFADNIDMPETSSGETIEVSAQDQEASENIPATNEQKAETPSENADVPADVPDTQTVGEKEPAQSIDNQENNPESPAVNEELSAMNSETSADTAESQADDNGTPKEEPETQDEAEAAPEPTPIVDTSESVTMLQAGFVPAPVYFEGTLVHEGADYTVTAVIGSDAMFPADVSMRVEEILPGTELYEYYIRMMEETMEADEEIGEFARFFDIAFIADVEGKTVEIEPQADIDVQITFREAIAVTEDTDVQAVHIEDNMPQILDASTDSLEAAVHDNEAIDTVSFSSDSFSVYGVYQKVKKILKVITASGETYTIDVTFTSDSGIPDDADLNAREITPDDPEYEALRTQAVLALDAGNVGSAHFFDIQISKDGEKIEPTGPVNVTIALDEMLEGAETVAVVHFGEGSTEIIANVEISDTDVQFQADSFSVYGVITDPTNEVNDLNGRIATISCIGRNNQVEYMTAEQLAPSPSLIGKTENASQAAQYYFVSTGEAGYYYIYTVDQETREKKYIYFQYRGQASGNSSAADTFLLTDTPQALKVEKFGNEYRISRRYEKLNFALDLWNNGGTAGQGFGGYNSGDDPPSNQRMRLNFVSDSNQQASQYVVIIKRDGQYYTVQNDGTLLPCTYHENTNMVEMEEPIMWTYSSVYGDQAYNLKIPEEALTFDYNLLPTSFAFRYIDPNMDSGMSHDVIAEGGNSLASSQKYTSLLIYENHTIYGRKGGPQNFLGVREEQGVLKISGNNNSSSAAEVYLAVPMLPSSPYGTSNAVNHIDLKINGTLNLNLAFAYGTYYLQDGTVITVDKDHPYSYTPTDYQVDFSQEDMTHAIIETYKINADETTTPLDDMFYVTGYSDNGNDQGRDQVRIEGFFKVSYTTVPGQNGNPESREARLATKVYYTVTVPKDVDIPLMYNGQQVYAENPITNPGAEPITVSTTVTLSSSFNYWDSNNACPTCRNVLAGGDWEKGDIPDGFADNGVPDSHTGSGMDFELYYTGSSGTTAIEVTKYVVDESGKVIHVAREPEYSFDIYYNLKKGAHYALDYSDVTDLTDPSVLSALDLESYTKLSTKHAVVGSNGFHTVYEYDIGKLIDEESHAMVYIRENEDSIDPTIKDQDGNTWEYTGVTRIVTEYASRIQEKPDYEVEGLTAFPEVIGTYNKNNSQGQGNGVRKKNDFLEFHVYNVYEKTEEGHGRIEISKVMEYPEGVNPLTNGKIFFALVKDGEYVYDEWGNLLVKTMNIQSDGLQPDRVVFDNLPNGEYEVWEMHGDQDNGYGRAYDGMPMGDGQIQIDKIRVIANSNGQQNANGLYNNNATIRNSSTESMTFRNTFKQADETTSFEVNKVWMDRSKSIIRAPQDASVIFTLFQQVNGGEITSTGRTITLDGIADNNGEISSWQAVFKDLPKQDQNGNTINYMVKETTGWPDFYPCKDNGNNLMGENEYVRASGGTIYNRRLLTTISIRKHFDIQTPKYTDEDWQEMLDKKQLLLELKRTETGETWYYTLGVDNFMQGGGNGTLFYLDIPNMSYGTYTLTEYRYKGLITDRKWDSGVTTVTRKMDPDSSLNDPTNELEVQNWYREGQDEPEGAYIYALKIWDDLDDLDEIRPESVQVTLFANGTAYTAVGVENPITLSEANSWNTGRNWYNLPIVDNEGHPVNYTVQEIDVPVGYTSTMTVSGEGAYTITNTHRPENMGTISLLKHVSAPTGASIPYKYYFTVKDSKGIYWSSTGTSGPDYYTAVPIEVDAEVPVSFSVPEGQYTVSEIRDGIEIPGYSVMVTGEGQYTVHANETTTVTVTNIYTGQEQPGTVSVLKNWEGSFSEEEKTATVQLMRVAKPVGDPATIRITGKSDWHNFEVYKHFKYYSDNTPIRKGDTVCFSAVFRWNQNGAIKAVVSKGGSFDDGYELLYPEHFTYDENAQEQTWRYYYKFVVTDEVMNLEMGHYQEENWTVTRISSGTGISQSSEAEPEEYEQPVLLNSDNNYYYKWTGLSSEYTYYVEEVGQADYVSVTYSYNGGEVPEEGITHGNIVITNKKETGDISVSKNVKVNDADSSELNGKTIPIGLFSTETEPEDDATPDKTAQLKITGASTTETLFTNLPLGTYYVYELDQNDHPIKNSGGITVDGKQYAVTVDNPRITLENAGNAKSVEITNSREVLTDIRVIKWKADTNPAETMTGAEFRLDRKTDGIYENVNEDENSTPVNGNGVLMFEGLTDGEYQIVETKAPAGFVPLASTIEFTITQGTVTYSGNSSLVLPTQVEGEPYTFNVYNEPGVALPSTGGSGTALYTLAGIALMALAGITLVKRRRKTNQ